MRKHPSIADIEAKYGASAEGASPAERELHLYQAYSLELRELRDDASATRFASKKMNGEPQPADPVKQRISDELAAVRHRKETGFSHDGGAIGDTKHRAAAIATKALVSDASPVLKQFVRRVGREVVSGATSRKLRTHKRYAKLVALDGDVIDGNRRFPGYLRCFFRGEFEPAAFETALNARAPGRAQIIAMPAVTEDGRLVDPEVLTLIDNPVDAGNPKAMVKYRAAHRTLMHAWLDIGCQPTDEAMRGLNPCCPRVIVGIPDHDAVPLSLDGIMDGLESKVSPAMLGTPVDYTIAIMRSVRNRRLGYWHSIVQCASKLIQHYWTESGNNRAAYDAAVQTVATAFGRAVNMPADKIAKDATKIAGFMWRGFRADKVAVRLSRRGPCAQETAGLSVRQAQAVGGRYAAKQQRNRSVKLIMDAVVALAEEGNADPTLPQIADRAGRSLRTVSSYIPEVRAALAVTSVRVRVRKVRVAAGAVPVLRTAPMFTIFRRRPVVAPVEAMAEAA